MTDPCPMGCGTDLTDKRLADHLERDCEAVKADRERRRGELAWR